jgi:hypothetical protein
MAATKTTQILKHTNTDTGEYIITPEDGRVRLKHVDE